MAKSLIVYKGRSDFESVNTMVDHYAAGFRRLGWSVEFIDLREPDHIGRAVRAVRSRGVDLFLSLNGYGIPQSGQGAGFYGETQAPVLIYYVDHPLYHYPTIRAELPRLLVTFPTAHHVDFCADFIRADAPMRHLPHAAAPAADLVKDWPERDIPVLVTASVAPDAVASRRLWPQQYGAAVADRLEAIVARHQEAPGAPLHHAIRQVLGEGAATIEDLYPYFAVADWYLRQEVKLATVKALVDSGVPVTVCGPGWPDLGPRATRLGVQPVDAVFGLMGRSQMVLNVLPPYYESHERPLQAAAHGAVAVNSPSPWVEKALGGHAIMLSHSARDSAEIIAAELGRPSLAERAACGRDSVLANHTWDHRAAALAAFVAAEG